MICSGCRKPIDPLYDSVARDERDEPWHTTCRVQHVGAQDTPGYADDQQLMTISPALSVGLRWWDKRAARKRR